MNNLYLIQENLRSSCLHIYLREEKRTIGYGQAKIFKGHQSIQLQSN